MSLSEESDLDAERKGDHVVKKIEIRLIQMQIKKWQELSGPAETRREAENGL